MASYTVSAGAIGKHDKTLVASTVDTVTFADDLDRVEIGSDGVAAIFVTVDGSTPTVSGDSTYKIPALASSSAGKLGVFRTIEVPTAGGTVVKLISSGTPVYDCCKTSTRDS